MAELIFSNLYIICALWEACMMCIHHKYYGDAATAEFNAPIIGVCVYIILFVGMRIYIYHYYQKTKYKLPKTKVKCKINKKRMNKFFLIWCLLTLVYTLETHVGVVGSTATSKISIIFSMFDITVIFPFYYILFRESEDKTLFWINIGLFSLLRIIQGWTGFILDIFMYELFFFFKNHKIKKNRFIKAFMGVCITLIIGAAAYSIFLPLKNSVRYHYTFSWEQRYPFEEAISALTSRLSSFSRGFYALANLKDIKRYYIGEQKAFLEIQRIFAPVLPRAIMPDKEFMSFGACVFAAINNVENSSISSSSGIIPYFIGLLYCDPASCIIWIFLFWGYIRFMKKLYSALEEYTGQLAILYFSFLLQIITTGSLEVLFSLRLLKLVYIFPLLYMMEIVRLKKNNGQSNMRICL